ncbi:MAG: CHASE4 domain-containing protein [Candidatus Paceibacterota bacterium]
MRIDRKIFYISLFLLLFFSVGFYLLVPGFAMKNFDSLEQSSATEEASKMRYFVVQEISNLDSINTKWSKREDLYEFFGKNKEEQDFFVSNDIDFQYMKDLKIDYLALIDNDGDFLYNIEIDNGLVQSRIPDDFLTEFCNSVMPKNCTGLVQSWQGDNVAAVSAKPVSEGVDSSPVGYIVMIKVFEGKATTYDGKEFVLKTIDPIVDAKTKKAESVLFIDKTDTDTLQVYSFYDDVSGKKSFYSKISVERMIYKSGMSIISAISYSVFILQLLMMISFLFIIRRIIIERLNLLIFSMQFIIKSKGQEKLKVFDGNDEISLLSQEINNAFIRINNARCDSKEKQNDLNLTIKSMQDIILVFDRDNKILFYHFPENKKIGMKKMEESIFLSKDFSSTIIDLIDGIKNSGNPFDLEHSIVKNGKRHWYNANISIKRDSSGEFDGVIVVIRNITTSKKMQEEMEEKISELQKLNKLMIGRELKMIELKETIKKLKK